MNIIKVNISKEQKLTILKILEDNQVEVIITPSLLNDIFKINLELHTDGENSFYQILKITISDIGDSVYSFSYEAFCDILLFYILKQKDKFSINKTIFSKLDKLIVYELVNDNKKPIIELDIEVIGPDVNILKHNI